MIRYFILSIICLLLNSCSSDDWLGEEDKYIHPGKRESVLSLNEIIEVDKNLIKKTIRVPSPQINSNWPSTTINQNNLLPENFALNENLVLQTKIQLPKYKHCGQQFIVKEDSLFTICDATINHYKITNKSANLIWSKTFKPEKENDFYKYGALLLHNNVIFAAAGHKQIFALNADNGKIIWSKSLTNVARATPYFDKNKVYFTTIDNKLYVLNASNGELLWSHQVSSEDINSINYPSAIARGNIVVASYSTGDLYILNNQDGQVLLNINLSNNEILGRGYAIKAIDTTPVIKGHNLFVMNNEGILLTINLNSGEITWKEEFPGYKYIWVTEDFIYLANNDGEVIAVSSQSGKIKWHTKITQIKDNKIKNIFLAGNNLLITRSNGDIIKMSPLDGNIISTLKTGIEITKFPVIANKKLYIINNSGYLSIWQ